MRARRIRTVLIIIGVLAFMAVLFYPSVRKVYILLPGGYVMWSTGHGPLLELNAREQLRLMRERDDYSNKRIGPSVERYRVFDNIITGYASEPRWPGTYTPGSWGDEVPGYFVIDTQAHVFYVGLSKQEWMDKLSEFGVTDEPRMYRPSRFDKRLGRNKPQ